MGLALAKKVVAEGGTVHLLGSSQDRMDKAVAQFTDAEKVKGHVLDISHEDQVKALAEQLGAIDHLVSTAARLTFKPLSELSSSEISDMIGSKLWGPILLTKCLAGKINKDGSIVYYSGAAADKGSAGAAIVGAVNSALHGLAKNLVYELSPVRVNVLSPGVVSSPTWDFIPERERAGFYKSAAEGLPAQIIGQPDMLAEAALYLMSNPYTNGTVLTVDGGANA
ncbi:SDR family oxidoreductase [Spirosoma pulveris]